MKYHPHGSVLFITFSIEEGLLLLSNPLCQSIVKSCLASAQVAFPVKICHFIIQATHVHMLVVVDNPDDIPCFIRHFKTESAHMLNRILGRRKRTIWCEGYDSPIVLTPVRALIAIAYLYANPCKDNLVASIDDFPGLSSWRMFRKKERIRCWKRLWRNSFKPLPRCCHTLRGYAYEAKKLLTTAKHSVTLTLTPDAWMDALGISDPEAQAKFNEKLFERIKTIESRARQKRISERKTIIGREHLLKQAIDCSYIPDRKGRKSLCLSESRKIRISFIGFLKSLFDKARAVRERWRTGDIQVPYPPGLYPPAFPKLCEPISVW